MSWRDAYFLQARSDYDTFKELNKSRLPLCHRLHYLQMASEKLAKAFLSPSNGEPPQKGHLRLVTLLKVIKGRPEIRRNFGFATDYYAFCSYVDSLTPFARQIELLAPVGTDDRRMNAEYPWLDPTGQVVHPAIYGFPEFPKTELIRFQNFLSSLFRSI